MGDDADLLFEVRTPLGFAGRVSRARWEWIAIMKHRDHAFLVTAYPTDAIKEGVRVWPK
jgi:hypothetical protein